MTKRVHYNWVDYARAIAIFGVVLLHANVPQPYRAPVKAFVIPLFFFLSGLFSNPYKYKDFVEFFRIKTKRILLPYLYFNIISYLFWLFLGRKFGLDADENINPLLPIFGVLYGTSQYLIHYIPLWFLTCLFVVETIYFLIFRYIKSDIKKVYVTLGFLLLAYINYVLNPHKLPWGIDIALTMIVFYSFASLVKPFITKSQIKFDVLILTSIISLIILLYMSLSNELVNAFENDFGNYFLFLISAFAGIFFIVSTLKIFDGFKPSKILLFVGNNTMAIFATHLMISSLIKGVMYFVLKINIFEITNSLWYSVLFSIISIITIAPIIIIINKYTPSLVGKK